MNEKKMVINRVREAFQDTPHPGDAFLVGSGEGCEPSEVIAPLREVDHWSQVSAHILDSHSEALSFFSEGGFRFFLPAYLIADLEHRLQTTDPVFHLTNGFSDRVVRVPDKSRVYEKTIGKSALLNPRRYGAMTVHDYARFRLSVFTREEAGAIVAYLEYRRDADPEGLDVAGISAAIDGFWLERVRQAPTGAMLQRHVEEESGYLLDSQSS